AGADSALATASFAAKRAAKDCRLSSRSAGVNNRSRNFGERSNCRSNRAKATMSTPTPMIMLGSLPFLIDLFAMFWFVTADFVAFILRPPRLAATRQPTPNPLDCCHIVGKDAGQYCPAKICHERLNVTGVAGPVVLTAGQGGPTVSCEVFGGN